MLKTALFAAAAMLTMANAPVLAAEPTDGAGVEGGKVVEAPVATARPDRTRYCVVDTITGSRIPHKECHTRQEWIATTGIDPLNKN